MPEDKVRVVAEALLPGTSIADVARRQSLSRSSIFEWRRLAVDGRSRAPRETPLQLLPVTLVPEDAPPAPGAPAPSPVDPAAVPLREALPIGVVLRNGRVMRVLTGADSATVARLAAALEV